MFNPTNALSTTKSHITNMKVSYIHLKKVLSLLLLILIALVSFNASAAQHKEPVHLISIDLVDAPLTDAIQLAIKGLINKNYVIHPDLVNADKKLTVQLQDVKKTKALNVIESILNQQGISIAVENDIIYVKPMAKQSTITQSLPEQVIDEPSPQTNVFEQQLLGADIDDKPIELNVYLYEPLSRSVDEIVNLLAIFSLKATVNGSGYIVYRTDKDIQYQITKLLEKVDKPSTQYEVIAATYEVTNQDDSQRSIDIIGKIFENVGISIITSGASNIIRYAGTTLSAAFKFFDSDTRFRSISKPYAMVKSGEKMRFQSGQDVPILGNITTNNNITQQSIEYRQSGVILNVELDAVKDAIDLKINHELSNFVQTRVGVNNSPTLNKQSLNTSVTVKDKEILVIGGLSTKTGTVSNTSALGFLPTERIKNSKDTETYVFLQVNKI